MSLTYLRGTRFIKDYFVKYINYIFYAGENDQIDFYDGTKKIEFSNTPMAVKQYSWDFRYLPVIEVGPANGRFEMRSIAKDYIDGAQYGDNNEDYKETGGDIVLDISFTVIATTQEERDNIVDILGVYLSHPTAKDFFQQHMIAIEDVPSISDEGQDPRPDIDHKPFRASLTMPVRGIWRDNTSQDEFLADIVAYIDTYEED